MIKDITLGQYLPGNSIIHRLDPRTKLLMTVSFMMVLFILNSILSLIISMVIVLSCYHIAGISYKYAFKGIKPVLYVIVFTVILNVFFTSGAPLLVWKFITISKEGVNSAILVSLRVLTLITSASIMTYTTTPIMLTDAIEKLFKPLKKIKVPVHEMAMMMTIALRFIPTLIDETDKIMKAQAARGADIGTGNIIQRAKSFIPILVPLFISSFKRADDLAIAMESRCYRGGEGRTSMRVLKFTNKDLFAFIAFVLFTIILFVLQFFI
ncbi:MAG: energy-coupling factor transporter transmembrane protein EcfT [Clostridiales bacterium]|nr:energy-coupling factor transporter transmembrane protein EcfT [Clostridiales bacterium]